MRGEYENTSQIIEWEYLDWIDLSQDKGKRRTLVNTILNPLDSQNARNFLAVCGTVIDFWTRHCSMELVSLYVCMYVCVCMCLYVCMHVCIYICMCLCIYVWMCMHVCMRLLFVFLSLSCLCLEHSSFSMLRYARCGSNQHVVSARGFMRHSVERQLASGFSVYVLINSGLPSSSFSALSVYHL